MKKTILILFGIAVIVGAFALYYIAQGVTDAARHGGSEAARERRLVEISRKQNIGLPKEYGRGTVMLTTKAGPGLRFTYVFQLANAPKTDAETAAFAAKAKDKLIEAYKTIPEAVDFRKWEVELCWQYLDKEGSEITSVVVAPRDL